MSPALVERVPRILFLDAYDSFSNNIIALVEETLHVEVTSIKIDDKRFPTAASFSRFLQDFDAVISGPGPGTAVNQNDVGHIGKLWSLPESELVPVLGICLGFQSLAVAFGGRIERLTEPHHGIATEVLHKGRSIFKDLGEIKAIQYHSLCANIGHPIQVDKAVKFPGQLWQPSETCPDLEPLAWDFDDRRNGAVLMGLRHSNKPFWGVQYHPESICTNEEGAKIVRNWWDEVQQWNDQHNRPILRSPAVDRSPAASEPARDYFGNAASPAGASMPARDFANLLAKGRNPGSCSNVSGRVEVATCGSGRLRVDDICHLLQVPAGEAIVLESGLSPGLKPHKAGTGRYSIIGLFVEGRTLRLHYFVKKKLLQLRDGHDNVWHEVEVDDIWAYIKEVMECLKPESGPSGASWAPFWGGLMGFVTYEACLDTINVDPSSRASAASSENEHPDICFAFVTRSIVIDHQVKKIYVQSLRSDDHFWVTTKLMQLRQAVEAEQEVTWSLSEFPPELEFVGQTVKDNPDKPLIRTWATMKVLEHYLSQAVWTKCAEEEYLEKIQRCLEAIRAGESYELCLTDQTQVGIPANIPSNLAVPWHMYRRLLRLNSAPFSAYIRIGKEGQGVNILSSSPERFLSWDRSGICQCRPIKGTVKKDAVNPVSRQEAEEILSSSKERAENLMIVDLTRHQLYGVYGTGSVNVKQLMEVEEYETVYQLVSVIEAIPPGVPKPKTPEEWDNAENTYFPSSTPSSVASIASTPFSQPTPNIPITPAKTGIDMLAASLPPGSMTGAPKKRSCELLQGIENHKPRGIYSGIIGYIDVGGAGDFSVVIRTAYSWDDEKVQAQPAKVERGAVTEPSSEDLPFYSVWRIGAGGAITIQSSPESEWEEMQTKMEATLRMFEKLQVRDLPKPGFPRKIMIQTVESSSEDENMDDEDEDGSASEQEGTDDDEDEDGSASEDADDSDEVDVRGSRQESN